MTSLSTAGMYSQSSAPPSLFRGIRACCPGLPDAARPTDRGHLIGMERLRRARGSVLLRRDLSSSRARPEASPTAAGLTTISLQRTGSAPEARFGRVQLSLGFAVDHHRTRDRAGPAGL